MVAQELLSGIVTLWTDFINFGTKVNIRLNANSLFMILSCNYSHCQVILYFILNIPTEYFRFLCRYQNYYFVNKCVSPKAAILSSNKNFLVSFTNSSLNARQELE